MCESVSHIISPLAKLFTVSRLMVTNVVRGYCDGWCESVSPPRGRDVSHNGGRQGGSDSSNTYSSLQFYSPPDSSQYNSLQFYTPDSSPYNILNCFPALGCWETVLVIGGGNTNRTRGICTTQPLHVSTPINCF